MKKQPYIFNIKGKHSSIIHAVTKFDIISYKGYCTIEDQENKIRYETFCGNSLYHNHQLDSIASYEQYSPRGKNNTDVEERDAVTCKNCITVLSRQGLRSVKKTVAPVNSHFNECSGDNFIIKFLLNYLRNYQSGSRVCISANIATNTLKYMDELLKRKVNKIGPPLGKDGLCLIDRVRGIVSRNNRALYGGKMYDITHDIVGNLEYLNILIDEGPNEPKKEENEMEKDYTRAYWKAKVFVTGEETRDIERFELGHLLIALNQTYGENTVINMLGNNKINFYKMTEQLTEVEPIISRQIVSLEEMS